MSNGRSDKVNIAEAKEVMVPVKPVNMIIHSVSIPNKAREEIADGGICNSPGETPGESPRCGVVVIPYFG